MEKYEGQTGENPKMPAFKCPSAEWLSHPDRNRSQACSVRLSRTIISFKGKARFSLSPEDETFFFPFSFSTSVTPSQAQRQVDYWDLLASWLSLPASSKFRRDPVSMEEGGGGSGTDI